MMMLCCALLVMMLLWCALLNCEAVLHRVDQALDVDPATGEVEGDEEGFPEEYPLEQLNIATADFMAKVSGQIL